ncbi:MAG: penicillin acylase family protein [Chloroflexi bacterium]|nr:penicillin acylase family protein [Chloroflexota bacterium]
MPFGLSLNRFGVAAGATGALAAGAFGYLLRRPLPPLDGEIRVKGVSGMVEIVRDRWGIPHISAREPVDAYFGQGFCHAQDRLWQMELTRRLACGRLAEVFGQEALDVDRFQRRIGLHRAAQAEWLTADTDLRDSLRAYAAGVNACLDGLIASKKLPPEFVLARFEPAHWEPTDTLAFARYLAHSQSPNWESELVRSRLIARVGYAQAASLEPEVWQPQTGALPHLEDWGPPEMPESGELPPLELAGGPLASNAWAVSGTRSSTGKPLLANDPHMFPRFPSVFYEAHLAAGGELNVAGGSVPGAPGILIGHNRHIAWGITASMADVSDLYVERLDPGDARRTEFAGRWETGSLVRETIPVKGRTKPWLEEVLLTSRHGPLLTPTVSIPDEHRSLALRSMVLEAPSAAAALLRINRARSWDEFREAARGWGTPAMNLTYADAEGNIGYQLVGKVPIRERGEGLVPSPGWSGQYEWRGSIPFDDLPHAFNPPDGLWANANHNVAKNSPYFFTREFIDPARYHRIRQVLESKERHSAVDFGALQADEVSLPARRVADLLVQHQVPANRLEAMALDELRHWDGRVSADSAAASIYEVFRNELIRARHAELVGDLVPALLGVGAHPLLAAVNSHYFLQTQRVLSFMEQSPEDPVIGRAFRSSVAWLGRRLGANVVDWHWGRLHQLHLEHALSLKKPLGLMFNVPRFAWGGDLETVRAGGSWPDSFKASGPISAYRFIADCGDWDNSLSCIPGGQSGQRGSPHYADQVDAWRRVAYHPLSFTRPAISRVQRHNLRLIPDGG